MRKLYFIVAISFVVISICYPLALYFYIFAPISEYSLSTSEQVWSNFGSFVGGTVGTIFSFLTFLGAALAVYYQKKQLDAQTEALKLEEIHSLLSKLSERLDELIYAKPKLYPHQELELDEISQKIKLYLEGSFISIVATLGTLSLSKKYNKKSDGAIEKFPEEAILKYLQQSAFLINVEINNYGRLLSIYKNCNGDHELIEFYKGKYFPTTCWLNSIGLLNAPLINEHIDFDMLEHVLVGNNYEEFSSSVQIK